MYNGQLTDTGMYRHAEPRLQQEIAKAEEWSKHVLHKTFTSRSNIGKRIERRKEVVKDEWCHLFYARPGPTAGSIQIETQVILTETDLEGLVAESEELIAASSSTGSAGLRPLV